MRAGDGSHLVPYFKPDGEAHIADDDTGRAYRWDLRIRRELRTSGDARVSKGQRHFGRRLVPAAAPIRPSR
jgi:hypothetical protein